MAVKQGVVQGLDHHRIKLTKTFHETSKLDSIGGKVDLFQLV
jgi:hypothetical protein